MSTALDNALSFNEQQEAAKVAARDAERADACLRYVAILCRNSEPLPDDGEELASLMSALKLSPSDVRADLKRVHDYFRSLGDHLALTNTNAAARAARDELTAFIEQAAAERQRLEGIANSSAFHYSRSRNAASELKRLRSERPDLFEDAVTGDVPRLLGIEVPCLQPQSDD